MRHYEDALQETCVKWFRLLYFNYAGLLFAVANGGKRNAREAGRLKRQGVLAGVSDLILAVPTKKHHCLFIELKVGKNKQTDEQIKFQRNVEKVGNRYVLCYSFDDFRKEVVNYMTDL